MISANPKRTSFRISAVIVCAMMIGSSLTACDRFLNADERVSRADALIAGNDYRGALIELKNALQDEPNHVIARTRLVAVELQLGDVANAANDLKRAVELGAKSAAIEELKARIDLAFGRARELLASIDAGEMNLEGSARPLYRGLALLATRQFAAAEAEFATVPANDVRAAAARIGTAEAMMGLERSEEAIKLLDELIAAQPSLAEAWMARGIVRARRGEAGPAETDLERAYTLGGKSLDAARYMSLLAALTELRLARGDLPAATATQKELARFAPDAPPIRVLGARIAMAQQDYSKAVSELQRAVAVSPDGVAARFLLGAALFAQGNLYQAQQQFLQVLQRSPENLEARKLLAQIHLLLNRPDAAMDVLLPAQGSEDPRLDLLLGLALLQQGNEGEGVAHLERAARTQPGNINLQLDLATAYLKAERPDKAVALLSTLDRPPSDLRYSGLLIAALSAAGNVSGARAEVDRVLSAHPRDGAALNLAAGFFARQREFERARALTQRALDVDPGNQTVLLTRARIEEEAGDLAAAQAWLEKAAAADAKGAASLELARLALRRGDSATAIQRLEALRAGDANAVAPRMQLMALYMRQRNSAALKPVNDELTALGKDKPEIRNALGEIFLGSGRYDEALNHFQAASAQDNGNSVYWLNLARTQILLGNSSAGRVSLEKAIEAQPGWLPAVGTLAMLDVKEGNQRAALDRIAELRKARPRDAATLTLEGEVQMAVKEYAKAASAYEAAAAIRPAGVLALKIYKARELGKLPAPRQPLEKWVAGHPDDNAVRLVLAEAYQREGAVPQAVAEYETLARGKGGSPIVLNNLAWLYLQLGDSRAEETARRAHVAAPGSQAVTDTYAWILVQTGKADQGLELFRKIPDEGRDASVDYHHAVALIRTGATQEGQRRLSDLLRRSPAFPEAADAKKLLQSLPTG